MSKARDVRVDRATLTLLSERHGDDVLDHIRRQIALSGTGPGSKRVLFDGRYEEMIPFQRDGLPYVVVDGRSLRITADVPEAAVTLLKGRPLDDLVDLGPVFEGRTIESISRKDGPWPSLRVDMEADDVFLDFIKNND